MPQTDETQTSATDKRTTGPWCVDVVMPLPLDQTFTYTIPDRLAHESIQPGLRVLVPFGSRLRYGVTWSTAYAAETDGNSFRQLLDVESEPCLLPPVVRRILEWMSRYYQAPLGEALKAVLPPGVLRQEPSVWALTDVGRAWVADNGDHPDASLLAHLDTPLNLKTWVDRAGQPISVTLLRRFERDGLINMLSSSARRPSLPAIEVVSLTPKGRDATQAACARAPKQWQALQWLQQQNQEVVALTAINREIPRGSGFLRRLANAGMCRLEEMPLHQFEAVRELDVPSHVHELTDEQAVAVQTIEKACDTGEFRPFLIHGVTGSGKTEIYLRAIEKCLAVGRQALLLVPEIGLTPLMRYQITSRFGDTLAILHSAFGKTKRSAEWAKILSGKVDLVLGARSAVFAPLTRLGLIVVDEEQDQSYKQNEGIRYHARNLALMRGKMEDAVVVLGSATPSLESWHNHVQKKFSLLTLTKRATQAPLPKIDVVDMREEFQRQRRRPVLSQLLVERMRSSLDAGEQVMILLNRRGFHRFLLCRRCGQAVMCPRCEVTLTYHRRPDALRCHYCDYVRTLPRECPDCGEPAHVLHFFGEGTQQVEAALTDHFPDITVDRLDRDRARKAGQLERVLDRFRKGETQILVGTQMIAKGHDFHRVTLVGILNADLSLRNSDFRSAELTYQLITQVAGRSGRGKRPGTVVIQTYMPEHYSITCAATHDFSGFLKREWRFRQQLFYPPFSHMVQIVIFDRDYDRARRAGRRVADFLAPFKEKWGVVVLGPVRAPVARIKNEHRFQILLKSDRRALLHDAVRRAAADLKHHKIVPPRHIIVDIDPCRFG